MLHQRMAGIVTIAAKKGLFRYIELFSHQRGYQDPSVARIASYNKTTLPLKITSLF